MDYSELRTQYKVQITTKAETVISLSAVAFVATAAYISMY